MRKIIGLTLVLLLVFIISACGNNTVDNAPVVENNSPEVIEESAPPEAPALEMSELSLGTARDPQLAAQFIIANSQGFFEEEGLVIDLQLFPSGSDLTTAIAGKSILMGSAGDVPSTILKATGNEIQVIGQQSDISGAQALIVKPAITHPKDLNGKKVAFSPGNSSEALFLAIVDEYGLDTSSMEIFKMGASEMLAAFIKGDIEAFVVWEPTALQATQNGGIRLLSASESFISGEEGEQKLYGMHSLLLANSDFLEANPETTKAVLRALLKAIDFIESNPDGAAVDVAGALSSKPADIRAMMDVNKYSLAITPELITDITAIAEFLKSKEKITEIPDYSEFVNPIFLKEVAPDKVTWTP